MARSDVVATYSIVACDLDARQWGVGVQSKFLAVGSVVPWAEPHVGAIATQSYANPRYGPDGLGRRKNGERLCGPGEHSRVAGDGRRAGDDVRAERAPVTRGTADRVPRSR